MHDHAFCPLESGQMSEACHGSVEGQSPPKPTAPEEQTQIKRLKIELKIAEQRCLAEQERRLAFEQQIELEKLERAGHSWRTSAFSKLLMGVVPKFLFRSGSANMARVCGKYTRGIRRTDGITGQNYLPAYSGKNSLCVNAAHAIPA